jgi:hypothetical protein
LELERTRRRAAEDLGAERAHTIQTLERALRALQAHHTAPTPNSDRAALLPALPSDATYGRPAPQSGMLPMVPKRRRAKRELSQEEKAASLGGRCAGNGHQSGAGPNRATRAYASRGI